MVWQNICSLPKKEVYFIFVKIVSVKIYPFTNKNPQKSTFASIADVEESPHGAPKPYGAVFILSDIRLGECIVSASRA